MAGASEGHQLDSGIRLSGTPGILWLSSAGAGSLANPAFAEWSTRARISAETDVFFPISG